jgi:hypothetical protein
MSKQDMQDESVARIVTLPSGRRSVAFDQDVLNLQPHGAKLYTAPQAEPMNAELLAALRKCKTCALPTEVRDLVNAAIARAETQKPHTGDDHA